MGTLERSITPTGAGKERRGGPFRARRDNHPHGGGGWDRGKFTVAPHDATGAGTDGLLHLHHHGLKAEARLCSWTGDLA
jgi:hypothetical protein